MALTLLPAPTTAMAATSGVRVVMVTGCSSGTNLQFSMSGNSTASMPCATSTAAMIQSELLALPGLGSDITVSGIPTAGAYMLTLSGVLPEALTGTMLAGGTVLLAADGTTMSTVSVGVPAMSISGGAQPLVYGVTIMQVTAGSLTDLDGVSGCTRGGIYTTTVNGSFIAYDSRVGAAGSTAFMVWYPGGVITRATPFVVSCA